jgi:hypothetical protein
MGQINMNTVDEIIMKSKSLALLDLILMPEWEDRYFSFDSNWAKNEMLASMKNGEGAEYFINFSKIGAVGKVFDGEINILVEDFWAEIPVNYKEYLMEPAFNIKDVTFCFWMSLDSLNWNYSPNRNDSLSLLDFIDKGYTFYHKWAEEYYDCEINFEIGKKLFDTHEFDEKTIEILNPDLNIDDIKNELDEILGK